MCCCPVQWQCNNIVICTLSIYDFPWVFETCERSLNAELDIAAQEQACGMSKGTGCCRCRNSRAHTERGRERAERATATVARRDDEILDKRLSPERGACWKS